MNKFDLYNFGVLQGGDLPQHARAAISAFVTMVNTGDVELIAIAKRNMDNRMAIVTQHAFAETWWQYETNQRRKRYQQQWITLCDTIAVCVMLIALAVYVWKQLPN